MRPPLLKPSNRKKSRFTDRPTLPELDQTPPIRHTRRVAGNARDQAPLYDSRMMEGKPDGYRAEAAERYQEQ